MTHSARVLSIAKHGREARDRRVCRKAIFRSKSSSDGQAGRNTNVGGRRRHVADMPAATTSTWEGSRS